MEKIDCEFKELLKSEEIVKNEKQNLMINQEQMERMMRNPTGVLNSNHSRRWSIMLYLNHILQNPKKQIVSLWFFLKVIDMFYELLDNTQQKIIAICQTTNWMSHIIAKAERREINSIFSLKLAACSGYPSSISPMWLYVITHLQKPSPPKMA